MPSFNPSRSHRTLILRLHLTILLASTTPALAIDYTWDAGGGTNNWGEGLNWNPNGIPTNISIVTFPTLGGSYLITHVGPAALNCASITFDTTDNITMTDASGFSTILLLDTGDITRTAASAGTQTIQPTVRLGDHGVWNINGAGSLVVSQLDEAAPGMNLTKSGNGTLTLGTSAYTGTTTISNGILRAGASSLGSNIVTVSSGGTLVPLATINRTLVLNGTGFSGLGALRLTSGLGGWSGPLLLSTNSTIGVDTGSLTITGVIDDGAFTRSITKVGDGTLILSTANTYNGSTTVSAGQLWVDHTNALGTGNVTVTAGASLVVPDGITSGSNIAMLNGSGDGGEGALRAQTGLGTWAGNILLQSQSSLGANSGELLITGTIGQTVVGLGFTKVGPGKVSLANNGTYNGAVTVSQGVLNLRHNTALGSAGAVVSAGGTLALQESLASIPVNVNRFVSLNGAGASGSGALRNLSSNNTWSGGIILQSASDIGVDADQLTISGQISGPFTLTKVGPGTLVLTNTTNSYNSTLVDEGTLNITVPNAIPASTTITVHDGGAIQVGGGTTHNRFLTLNGGGVSDTGALLSTSGVNTWANAILLQSHSSFGVAAGELRITGEIGGEGGLFKVGPGKLTLTFNNGYAGPTNVAEGILSVENSQGIPTASIPWVSDGAAIELRNGVNLTNNLGLASTGILGGGGLRNASGNNTWSGGIRLVTPNASIGADAGTQLTVSGVITDLDDSFPLTKVGPGTLVLSNANTYEGGTLINGGTLSISADNNLGLAGTAVTNNNGGKLLVTANMTSGRTFNLNTGSLQVESGATLTYANATVNGGFLRGPGTHSIGVNSTFSGVTALNGTNITQSSLTTLVNFTNAGTLTSSAALTWDGGFNTSAGVINVHSSFNTQAFENDGVITVFSGGAITNTTSPLVSGGGGRITIHPGATINAGPGFELNGSLLVNNGTVSGTTNVNFGSLAKGSGVYGTVNVNDGGRFSPGNSPGAVATGSTTWNSGGSYIVEIADLAHDLWRINGQLNLNASAQNPFTIFLASLEDLVFDPAQDHSWPILHADAIHGDGAIVLDTSEFERDLGGGHFWLQSTSSDLIVNFSAVPEPSTMGLFAAGIVCALCRGRRNA